jgi:hypothetical protein
MQIQSHGHDGYLCLYPKPPVRADNRYKIGDCNPNNYLKRYGIPIQEGELMQAVYVWDDSSGGYWGEREIQQLKDYFPAYIPLKDIVNGEEGKTVEVKVKDQTFTLLCSQQKEKFPSNFESYMKSSLNQILTYPARDVGEVCEALQPFNGNSYRAVVKRLNANAFIGDLDPQLVYKIFLNSNKKITTVNQEQLKRIYTKEEMMGGGRDGGVFRVRKTDGSLRALKICTTYPYRLEEVAVINHLLDTNLTPHFVRIHRILRIKANFNPLDMFETSSSKKFIKINKDYPERWCSVLEMELMEGDLTHYPRALSPREEQAIKIQYRSAAAKLNRFCTDCNDSKFSNILYKDLGNETFQGKLLADYDFVKYAIGENVFFIPKADFIMIKICDYDEFRTTLFAEQPIQDSSNTYPSLKLKNLSIEELKEMFPAPTDPDAKILDMNSSN